ncbi:MAG: beta-aspartyl-peptidase (threonine type), partial [Rhodothermales bacterium]
AWDIPESETQAHLQGMQQALKVGVEAVGHGKGAIEIVEAVIASQEDSGVFDAGRGSVLTQSGLVEMDAGIMRGGDLAFGAVGALRTIANPIAAAAHVLTAGRGEVRFLVGREAEVLLEREGLRLATQTELVNPREYRRWQELSGKIGFHTSQAFLAPVPRGTVGCVVRDADGLMAAGTSTGGTPFRPEGRVGDSPLPGCGYYADRGGASSATGWGEAIAAAGVAGRAVGATERGVEAEEAVRVELTRMRDRISNHEGKAAAAGLILLTSSGSAAWGYNTPRMARGAWSGELGFWLRLEARR